MFYNIVLVSAIHQCESAIGIHMSSLSLKPPSHPPLHPTPPGCHRAPYLSSMYYTANFHGLSNFTHIMYMFQGYSLHLAHPLLLTVSAICSLWLPLHCCPADRFISTIFLDSINIYINIWYLSFSFCTSSCIIDSRSVKWLHS